MWRFYCNGARARWEGRLKLGCTGQHIDTAVWHTVSYTPRSVYPEIFWHTSVLVLLPKWLSLPSSMSLRHLIGAGFFEKKKKAQQLMIAETATGGILFLFQQPLWPKLVWSPPLGDKLLTEQAWRFISKARKDRLFLPDCFAVVRG